MKDFVKYINPIVVIYVTKAEEKIKPEKNLGFNGFEAMIKTPAQHCYIS